jgi:CelD/BcsL family acetyltransferase involved in cellulose biosynthesis
MVRNPANGLDGELKASLLEDICDLEACRNEWEELLAASATPRPMLGPLWLLAWWRTFGATDGRLLKVWTFRAEGRLVGLAPMLLRRHLHFGLLPMRRLELLATGEREADEIMSEYLAPIVAKGYEEAVAEAWVRQLALHTRSWQEIVLSALDSHAPAVVALQPALQRQGWSCQLQAQAECPFIKLPSHWEDYLSALPSRNRYLVLRSLRDFTAWAGDAWRFERAATQADLARGREILLHLHGERWNKDGRPGVFASPLFLRFHDAVLPQLLEREALELCWLSVRDRPVAIVYNIVWHNRVYFYQGGRAVDVPKGVRPGVVLHMEAIKRAIEQGREEYDFLGGASRYKMQLALATHPLHTLRIVRPSLPEAARILLDSGIAVLREARRRQTAAEPGVPVQASKSD